MCFSYAKSTSGATYLLSVTSVCYYRPQTKFAKVMFLHVSVSHSVHRVVVSQHALQVSGGVSQHALQVSRPTSKAEVEGFAWGEGGLQAHTQGGGGLQAHTWGSVSQHALRQTPQL